MESLESLRESAVKWFLADGHLGCYDKIKISTNSLLGIINDILDFSKIEAGRLELECTDFSLDDVLHNLSVVISTAARDKGIETVFSVDPSVPARLVGDPLRLTQVLLNLAGNAVKFTAHGEVVLSVAKTAADETGVTLTFSARDTGVGIPVDRQSRLFSAFSQADSSTSRRYGGTGLGLAISSRLVALMGGALTFTSQPGVGSDFRFAIRFGLTGEAAEVRASSGAMNDLDVLVVDDHDTAREVLARACRSFGWSTRQAASAAEGLALLRGPAAFDILLLDWRMPEMDGIEMLAAARDDPTIRLPPVILMVTAFGVSAAEAGAGAIPIDGILAKPATPSALFDAVAKVRGGKPISVKPAATALSGRLAGLRLLLVEDNEINQGVARDILERTGAGVEVVGDGQAAVDALRRGGGRFDAVLMDVQMPVMDGYEATRIIRGDLGLTALPIIAITANAMDTDRQKSREAGMDAHIGKPMDVEALIATLRTLIPGFASGAGSSPGAAKAQVDFGFPVIPGIEGAEVSARLAGNRSLFLTFLGQFHDRFQHVVAGIRADLAAARTGDAARTLHALRGVAGNVSANEVARLAAEVESGIRNGRTDEASTALDGLDTALAALLGSILAILAGERGEQSADEAASAAPLDQEALAGLMTALRSHSAKALGRFEALRPAIAATYGRALAASLHAAIDGLRFDEAADGLAAVVSAHQQSAGRAEP